MKVSVLGCGRWGSFIAWYLNKIGHNVTLWGRETSLNLKQIIDTRRNDLLYFDSQIKLSYNLEESVNLSDVIVISISCQDLFGLCDRLSSLSLSDKPIVLCMKGIDVKSTKRLTEVVQYHLGELYPVAVWVGPGHVQDFIKNIPNCMIIDSNNDGLKMSLVTKFSSSLIRFYIGSDLIGSEIGAASKNVIGIAAGMLDGLGYSSLKGALMSRGTQEISRLIVAMGGNSKSAYGLSHLGDYQATLFSEHSRNRKFGESFVQKKKYTKLAEGVATTKAIVKLGEKYHLDLPIVTAVDSILNNTKSPEQALSELFLRSIKEEF